MNRFYISTVSLAALLAAGTFAAAQEQPSPAQPAPPAATEPAPAPSAPSGPSATEVTKDVPGAEAETQNFKSWVGMTLQTVDGKEVGEIAAVMPETGAPLQEVHADIGGFLGFGQTRVKLNSGQVTKQGDKIIVSVTEDELKNLPKVEG